MRVVFSESSEGAGGESQRDVFLKRVKRVRDSLAAVFGALTPDLLDNPDLLPLALKDGPALLTGEPGVGKTQLARILHAVSLRVEHPFVPLNCAGLSSDIARAQLFGHTKGAFTGADKDSPGIFSLATQGTVLLDDITEVNPDFQAALLEFLESRTFLPVGARKAISSDVRVIAATNQDPDSAIREGLLRQDLYDRLARGGIFHVPPLRERPTDVLRLAEHFVRVAARGQGFSDISFTFSEEDQAALQSHAWPGNLRELDRVVSAAFLRACLNESAEVLLEIPARRFSQERVLTGKGRETQKGRNGEGGVPNTLGKDSRNDLICQLILKALDDRECYPLAWLEAVKREAEIRMVMSALKEEGSFNSAETRTGKSQTFIEQTAKRAFGGEKDQKITRPDILGMARDWEPTGRNSFGGMVDRIMQEHGTVLEVDETLTKTALFMVSYLLEEEPEIPCRTLAARLGCAHTRAAGLMRDAKEFLSRGEAVFPQKQSFEHAPA